MRQKPSVAITPRRDGRWAVKRDGAKRASSLHDTRRAAEAVGRAIAEREKTQFVLLGRAGDIQRRDDYATDTRPGARGAT